MGLKKYEIITVGNDRRVRALRSWQVGDRYVNIGDVGGIVYDEKTLSQDGACWLFRGNFGFPGARIGGDSIVDVGEETLSTAGSPAVDILGSSVLVGSKLIFGSDQTAADAVVLTADDFEQGGYASLAVGQKPGKDDGSANFIRIKNPIFMGGKSIVIKAPVPRYIVTVLVTDADGYIIKPYKTIITNDYQSIPTEAGQYAYIRLTKNPVGPTVPADATSAQLTFTGTYETKLSIIDSRLEINPANATGTATIKPGGTYMMALGVKYPEAIIRNSKVSVTVPAAANRVIRLMGQVIGSTAALDATASDVTVAGQYSNIKNLMVLGILSSDAGVNAYNSIQATDCDNFAVSSTIFPGREGAQTANMPFIFQGCNVPDGRFYHHAQIANTYKNIDFAKAQADLGKATANVGVILVSSEAEGMYRAAHRDTRYIGALVESWESVKSLSVLNNNPLASYGTTIYKDAYFNGFFEFEGTNVFGNKVRSHPLAQVLNVQPRAVQGGFALVVGQAPTPNVDATRVRTEGSFRINGANGISVQNIPAGLEARIVYLDGVGRYVAQEDWYTGSVIVPNVQLINTYAYLLFRKTGDAAITPEDLAGVTVTVYNGCKIVNTRETMVSMKGNIRVEDNATLINTSVTGTGYFGGNTVASGLFIAGSVFMNDNAKFIKTAGTNVIRNLRITENGSINLGDVTTLGVVQVADNAVLSPTGIGSVECDLFMSDNASLTSSVTISGVLRMKDDAKVNVGTLTTYGDVTLCGSYNQTTAKGWTGKRVIENENEPTYDNNVKTQYDF